MRYRLLAGTGEVLEEGEGSVEMAGGALVLSPVTGEVFRVAPAEILEISEPEPYAVRLRLVEGSALDLLGLGALRTQLLAELADARATGLAHTLLLDGVGDPELFPGAVGEVDAELRLYDDALVVLPARGDAEKLPYPFIREVVTDEFGYRVNILVAGREPLVLQRLGRRTTEFIALLRACCRETAGRTAAFLGALLPGLGPIALRATAALLRDGLAGSRTDLDAIDPAVWPALTAAATVPERVGCLRVMESLGPVWLGLKQVVPVKRPARGGQPWRDPAITPNLGGHGPSGDGFGGMLAAGALAGGPGFDGPFQAMGAMLAYRMLGTHHQHPVMPRANVTRGRLTPATTDFEALTVSGDRPTVLAFALGLTPGGALVYEALNDSDVDTYVYRAGGVDELAALNRALDLVGFRVAAAHDATRKPPAVRLLNDALVGRVDHTDGWTDRLRDLV